MEYSIIDDIIKLNARGNAKIMSTQRRSYSEIKRRRARRNRQRKLILMFSMFTIVILGIILLLVLFGKDKEPENGTTGSVEANATASSVADEKTTNQEKTTEETTTEEPTTLPPLRYGDEMYVDGELVVCIDPGHGSNDTGCVGIDGKYEKDDVLMLSKLIIKELEKRDVKVVTTRSTDVWVDLTDRPKFANVNNADIMISVHRNSLDNDSVTKGFEAWIHSDNCDNSESLANRIMANLDQAGISKNRGVKKGTQGNSRENYAVNSLSAMPSVLLEMGFMSSPRDNQLFKDNAKEYAAAIADAIIQWTAGKQY